MFTAGELEGIPEALVSLIDELQIRIMLDIVRRMKANAGEITRAADWQIYRSYTLGKASDTIKKEIARTLELSNKEIDSLYDEAIEKDYIRMKALYKKGGEEIVPYSENEWLKQLVTGIKTQTKDELYNITRTMGVAASNKGTTEIISLTQYYTRTLDNAAMDIASGAFDYNTVLKRTVRELTNSGIRHIDYESVTGRATTARIDVAARRAVMTGVGQLTGRISEQNGEALHTDIYEVSVHHGCRPTHLPWQGGWYTMEQLRTICGYGDVAGLKGANCRHDFYPVIPGVDEPSYSAEELARIRKEETTPREYMGKSYTAYEASQRQRKLERTMRARRESIRLLKEGGAPEEEIIAERASYRAVSQEYTKFSKAMNLPEQRERVTIDGLGNIAAGKYTLPKEKPQKGLTNAAGTAIMETGETSELGQFKQMARNDESISEEYYGVIKEKFARGSDDAQKAFTKYIPNNSVANGAYSGIPSYVPQEKRIYMNYSNDFATTNERGGGVTWYHEHGHMIDDLAGRPSRDKEFLEMLQSDYRQYMIDYGKKHSLNTYPKIMRAIGSDLSNMRKHSAVSDLLDALSLGGIKGIAGHDAEYWTREGNIGAEAFAHMFEAQFDQTRYREMKKYFPNALKMFETMLKGIVT